MSIESMTAAMHHSRSTGTARLVLIGIANHDSDGGAWPSIATLKKYAGGIDKRNIQRALDKLEELGEIRKQIQAGGTPDMRDDRRPNRYEFLLKCPDYCDRTTNHRDRRKPLVNISFEDEFDGVATMPSGGDSATRGVATAPPKTYIQPTTGLNKETYVLNRESSTIHEYDKETGWCLKCINPVHRLEIAS